jgi:hypothetical protein
LTSIPATVSIAVSETVCREGLVAAFDILGYRNFVRNNSVEEATDIVRGVLGRIPHEIHELIPTYLTVHGHQTTPLQGEIMCKLFSDTIFLYTSYGEEDQDRRSLRWLLFISSCLLLTGFMFHNGLPVRGAVERGRYYADDKFLVGIPILDAYAKSQDLDVAACVLLTEAQKDWQVQLQNINFENPGSAGLGAPYLIPLKQGRQEVLYALNFIHGADYMMKGDASQLVHEKFSAHKKEVSTKEALKVENTEKLIRFLQIHLSPSAA